MKSSTFFVVLVAIHLGLFALSVSSLPAASKQQTKAKPKVELYYETLCPYSKNFYLEQLEPTFKKLTLDVVDVEVVPFGNVKVAEGPDGIPLFTCQHGAAECYGNRVQACVIALTSNLASLDYVRELCANQLGLNWAQIKTCHAGQQGLDLIIANWKRTDALVPKKAYVPWIVINGVHTEELQEAAQTDLLGYLCKNDLAGQNLPQCAAAKNKNSNASVRTVAPLCLTQLAPHLRELAAHLTLDLVPFGNVNVTHASNSSTPRFACQHGPAECYGNIAEACVIAHQPPAAALSFVQCMFLGVHRAVDSWKDTHFNAEACANLLFSNWGSTDLKKCIDGPEGEKLIEANWKKTEALKPKHTGVPWILVNEAVHTPEMQRQAQFSLKDYLCKEHFSKANLLECMA
ncbi:antigen processing and presentation of exogenous peptide antigen via MHC class I [Tyrophagus putrescentiae]|nr:antigen processing and presentation of exogenous peptide antigen via MHC class I [Tyrophagus putrescentiae]